MSASGRWWDGAFGTLYRTVYAHRDDACAAAEAAAAVAALGISAGARVLDAGCGDGRHSRALAARGIRAVGIDRSLALLAEARRRGGGPRYAAADFRALPFAAGCFDHVLSFFTSFGYFDAAGDAAQVREARRVTRRGGGLLLDFLNAPRVATTLVPETERRQGDATILERRAIRRGRVEKEVEVRRPGAETVRWQESVRLYGREEIEGLLSAAGFVVRAVHGDLRGGAWSETSDRLVVVGAAA